MSRQGIFYAAVAIIIAVVIVVQTIIHGTALLQDVIATCRVVWAFVAAMSLQDVADYGSAVWAFVSARKEDVLLGFTALLYWWVRDDIKAGIYK